MSKTQEAIAERRRITDADPNLNPADKILSHMVLDMSSRFEEMTNLEELPGVPSVVAVMEALKTVYTLLRSIGVASSALQQAEAQPEGEVLLAMQEPEDKDKVIMFHNKVEDA